MPERRHPCSPSSVTRLLHLVGKTEIRRKQEDGIGVESPDSAIATAPLFIAGIAKAQHYGSYRLSLRKISYFLLVLFRVPCVDEVPSLFQNHFVRILEAEYLRRAYCTLFVRTPATTLEPSSTSASLLRSKSITSSSDIIILYTHASSRVHSTATDRASCGHWPKKGHAQLASASSQHQKML